jgi:hypothetical protein
MATGTKKPVDHSTGFCILMRYLWWSDGDSNPGPSACKADLGLPVLSARICDCFLITNLTPHIHPLVRQRPHRWLSTWLSNGREPPDCSENHGKELLPGYTLRTAATAGISRYLPHIINPALLAGALRQRCLNHPAKWPNMAL